jgi:hypothetical protein
VPAEAISAPLSAAASRSRARSERASSTAWPTLSATCVATSTVDGVSSDWIRGSPPAASNTSSKREVSSYDSPFTSWNSSSTPRLNGRLLP